MKQIFFLLSAVIIFAACNGQQNRVKELSQDALALKLQDENVVLIDVRTPTEVASGHIPEASYFIDINAVDFSQKIAELDTAKTFIVYCRSGARSGRAASHMVESGFNNVYNLEGGILAYKGELKQ